MIARLLVALVLVISSPTVARAQFASPVIANGITVIGHGVVRVHADMLRFNAFLGEPNRNGNMGGDIDRAADAIVKALRDSGVADATTGYPGGFASNGPRSITGSVHKPTRESVETLVKKSNAAAIAFPNVQLQNLMLSFFVDDCSVGETRAQDAALADARSHAERAARAAGVRVGTVLNINEVPNFGPLGAANCATRPDTQFTGMPVQGNADANALGDVFVIVNATVTYAIVH